MEERIFENATIMTGKELEPIDGYLRIADGTIKEISAGTPQKSGVDLDKAFILPIFINSHTHLADSVKKDLYTGKTQPEVVEEDGEKFKALEEAGFEEKIRSIRDCLVEMKEAGTLAHCDFREEGIMGAKLLNTAEVEDVESIVLTRPKNGDEIEELLVESDGIGLPSLDCLSVQEIERISKLVSVSDKFLSFHVSETELSHEKSLKDFGESEISRALEFDPSFLVHGTWASREDLRDMREENVPLVLCSRANALLGNGVPPIKEALEEGVELWLGTDNVTVSPPDMFQEMSFAWSLLRLKSETAGVKEARELLKAATVNPMDDFKLSFEPINEGNKASFVVISRKFNLRNCENPFVGIVNRARVDNVEMVYFPKTYI